MKRFVFGIIAILSVFALVMTSCSSGGDDAPSTYTVTFNSNGGSSVDSITGVKSGSKITAPEAPTNGYFIFDGWYKADNTKWDFDSDVVKANITLTAKWLAGPYDGSEKVTLANATQVIYKFTLPEGKKWSDYEKITAEYLIPPSTEVDADGNPVDPFEVENSGRAVRLYGNYTVDFFDFNTTTAGNKYAYASLDGTANNNNYILSQEGGGWQTLSTTLIAILGECPELDKWFTIDYTLDGTKSNVKPHPHLPRDDFAGPFIFGLGLPGQGSKNTFYIKNVTLKGKNGGDSVLGTALYITKDGYDYPAFSAYGTAENNGVDDLSRELIGTSGTQKEIVAFPEVSLKWAEKVSLANATQVVYRFALPATKTWGDYSGVKADYLIPPLTDADGNDVDPFEVENSGRAMRLYGNYDAGFFGLNTTTAGNKYAYASLDGTLNNNQYILDDTGSGGWKTLQAALIAELGECPALNEWFTINYRTDGTRSNVKPHPHLPTDSETGPFILGLGLPGAGGTNTFYIRNVTLIGKEGTANVTGSALYLTKDGYDYPAFSAYGTASENGVDDIKRVWADGSRGVGIPYVEPAVKTVTFTINDADVTDGVAFAGGFTGTKTVVQNNSYLIGPLPTVTGVPTGKSFLGWATTSTATASNVTTGSTFNTDTTVYAVIVVPALPNATADADVTSQLTNKIFIFGGFSGAENQGLGPHLFDATNQYSCAIGFSSASITELTTAIYKEIKIELTVTKIDENDTLPMKLAFQNGRGYNDWNGGSSTYDDYTTNGEKTKTITIDADTLAKGIVIQHNGNSTTSPQSSSFNLTITKVTLVKP